MINYKENAQAEAYKAAQYVCRNLSYDLRYEQTVGDKRVRTTSQIHLSGDAAGQDMNSTIVIFRSLALSR